MKRWLKLVAGETVEIPNTPYVGAENFRAQGGIPYVGILPVSRLSIKDGAIVELPPPMPPPPVVRVFSRRSIYLELKALGLWDGVKGYMTEYDFLDEYTYSLDIAEDHPAFVAIVEQLRPILTEEGQSIDEIINRCVFEEVRK